MAIHRMRTISEAFKYIRKADPDTAVTANCIRTLCKEGKVNCVFTGKKILVDLDHLIEILCGTTEPAKVEIKEVPVLPPKEEPVGWMIMPHKINDM